MANRYRGEISAVFGGQPYKLCLTLGALAELESLFGVEDMVALATRFESGRICAGDAQRVIGAGLRGAGHDICDAAVGALKVENGAAGYVDVVARLLRATFGGDAPGNDVKDGLSNSSPEEGGEPSPFPGTT